LCAAISQVIQGYSKTAAVRKAASTHKEDFRQLVMSSKPWVINKLISSHYIGQQLTS